MKGSNLLSTTFSSETEKGAVFRESPSRLLSDIDFSVTQEKSETGRLGFPLPLLPSPGFLTDMSGAR